MHIERLPNRNSRAVLLLRAREGARARKRTLATLTNWPAATEGDVYAAMDWLGAREERIEATLAQRHLQDGCRVFVDVSSSFYEARTCPLGAGRVRPGREEGRTHYWLRGAHACGRATRTCRSS